MFDLPPDLALSEVVVHVASHHADRSQDFNERNYGLGLRFGRPTAFWTVGAYQNSYDRTSAYAGYGIGKDVGPFSFSLIAGAVTGYNSAVMPALVPEVGLRFGRFGIAINYLPRLKFGDSDVFEVLTFSLTARF